MMLEAEKLRVRKISRKLLFIRLVLAGFSDIGYSCLKLADCQKQKKLIGYYCIRGVSLYNF